MRQSLCFYFDPRKQLADLLRRPLYRASLILALQIIRRNKRLSLWQCVHDVAAWAVTFSNFSHGDTRLSRQERISTLGYLKLEGFEDGYLQVILREWEGPVAG